MVESHRQEIAKLEALYASNPGGRVFVHLAEALRKGGEHERARSILEEGLARHPDAASGHVVMGRLLMDVGAADEAESAFRTVLELDGGNLVALRCLGDLARSHGRTDEAVERYRELVARNPSSEDVAELIRDLEQVQAEYRDAAANEWPADAMLDESAEPADNAAPGYAGPSDAAEPEFGDVDFSALPGDLAMFAGYVAPSRPVTEYEEPEPRGLEDDVVELIESSAAPLELEELEGAFTAMPAEIDPLSAAPVLELPDDVEFEPPAEGWSTEAAIFGEPEEESAELDLNDLSGVEEEPVEEAALDLSDLYPSPTKIDEAPLDLTVLAPPAEEVEEEAPLSVEDLIAADEHEPEEPVLPSEPAWSEPEAETEELWAAPEPEPEPLETVEAWGDWTTAQEVEAEISFAAGFEDEMVGAPIDVGGVEASENESFDAATPEADPLATSEAAPDAVFAEPEPLQIAETETEPVEQEPLQIEAADVYDSHREAEEPYAFELAHAAQTDDIVPALREAWQADVGAPAASEQAAEDVASVDTASGDVVTETLADLYLAQGFAQRASEVYRALLRDRPADEQLAAKLRQAEAARPERADAGEDRGEVWLRGVESAWTGGAGATGSETTPYTWTEREEREEGIGIAAYLRSLLSWGVGEPVRPLEEVAVPEEPEPQAAETVAADETSFESASDISVTPEPEPWGVVPEEPDPVLEARAVEQGGAAPAGEPWSMTPEPVLDEQWGAQPEPALEPWSGANETPADPWLAPEPSAISGPPAPAPVASDDPVEAAFYEWFDESGGDPASAAGQPDLEPTEPTVAPTGEEPPAGAAEDDEDEDLEMFRAWLQSLKK